MQAAQWPLDDSTRELLLERYWPVSRDLWRLPPSEKALLGGVLIDRQLSTDVALRDRTTDGLLFIRLEHFEPEWAERLAGAHANELLQDSITAIQMGMAIGDPRGLAAVSSKIAMSESFGPESQMIAVNGIAHAAAELGDLRLAEVAWRRFFEMSHLHEELGIVAITLPPELTQQATAETPLADFLSRNSAPSMVMVALPHYWNCPSHDDEGIAVALELILAADTPGDRFNACFFVPAAAETRLRTSSAIGDLLERALTPGDSFYNECLQFRLRIPGLGKGT